MSNNAKLVEDFEKRKDFELSERDKAQMYVALENAEAILGAIGFLKENEHWHTLAKLVFRPAVESLERRIAASMRALVKDTTGAVKNEILQDQGTLVAFKKIADLDALENRYKVEYQNLSTRVNKLNA